MAPIFERISGAAARRPVLVVAIVLAMAIAGGILALGLKPSAGTDTFVNRSSPAFQATADDQRHFGDDAVIILVREKLTNLVQTRDLATITQLEACLGGQYVQANSKLRAFTAVKHAPYGGWGSPCGKLMQSRAAQVVYGPGTFLNQAVAAVNHGIGSMLSGANAASTSAAQQAYALAIGRGMSKKKALAEANAAGQLEYQQQLSTMEQLAVTSGLSSTPSIDDPQFIGQIVFDQTRGVNQPKARFAYLFPTADSALIQVRLRSSLSDAQQARAISWIRQAIRMPMFRSAYQGDYTVTGVPVVVNDLAGQISGAIAGLLIAALLVMAATLLIVFRSPYRPSAPAARSASGLAHSGGAQIVRLHPASPNWGGGESSGCLRLVPLAIALAAAGITFGLLAVLGAALTMASIAVLPILIGLAVDYGIQFQARAQEARAEAERAGGGQLTAAQAVAQAAGRAAPTIATAALATATGFLVLLLSPVPMVRGFGLLLVAGIVVALSCAVTVVSAALARFLAPGLRGAGEIVGSGASGLRRTLTPRARRTVEGSTRSLPARIVSAVIRRPARVLALAGVLAVAGWIADTQTSVQSDVTKLVPSSMAALRNLKALEKDTGVSGEIDVAVRGANVASPATLKWMIRYEDGLLAHYGYVETKGCARATLCPALSLPDLFSTGTGGRPGANTDLSQTQIDTLLRSVPPYFSQAVLTGDHREATLAFGIRLMALSRQQQVIDYMRSRLHPPAGVSAALTGLPVLAAQANQALSSTGHRFLTLIVGLLAVGLVLALVLRKPRRALVPMIPIALATGWSALILYLIGIPLNPMSVTLGTLVIAISTEFSVLLSERFRQERAAGHELRAALASTYRSTGAAVLASGITAIVGFGVLVFSNITMLRDFGFVTLVDLTVSLGGVLLVLPAVLALSERDARQPARSPWRALGDAVGRRRRGPRTA
jgi:hydrophobe/amphiphile efflux-3 (HAE3) family protein